MPPLFVIQLIDGLPLGSAYVSAVMAEEAGTPHEYLDKGHEWWALAALYDALMLNTQATGQWKNGKPPKFDAFPRPGRDKTGKVKKKHKPMTLNDLKARLLGRK